MNLEIDWQALGLNEEACRITAPPIPDFQPAAEFAPSETIPVTPGKGWLLLLERKK